MNKRIFFGICIFLLFIPIASAVTTYGESSSVARIIGESPSGMLNQMGRDALDINHATYFSNDQWGNKKDDILEEQFGSNQKSTLTIPGWNLNMVKSQVNTMSKNELLVIESSGEPEPLTVDFGLDKVYPKDFSSFQQKFQENNPLLVFDSQYAGSYLPKQDGFVARTAKDATIIAPSSFNSPQFTKSVLCQLAGGRTIGEVFKDARNFHYNGGSVSSSDNYIGLVLQSYALYGNPRQMFNMDFTEEDRERIKKYCSNYLENLAQDIEFLEQAGNYSKFRKHLIFEIPAYSINRENGFAFITSDNTFQRLESGELVLPIAIRTTHFPENTIFPSDGADAVENYDDLPISDIAMYENGFVSRACYEQNKAYGTEFLDSYSENKHDFVAKIQPVETLDCEEGRFRLYKKFLYHVDYIPLSPVLVKELNYPRSSTAGSQVAIDISLMGLKTTPESGSLAIFDGDNQKIWEKEITTDALIHNATFNLKNTEGGQKYSLEFIRGNDIMTYNEFSINSIILEPKAAIPASARATPSIELNFYSLLQEPYELSAEHYISTNNQVVDTGNFKKTLNYGNNGYTLQLPKLEKEEQSYTLTLELDYLGNKRTLTYLLSTNNIPVLYLDYKTEYYEGEDIIINYNAQDMDDDELTTTIDDNKFSKLDNSFVWRTKQGDKGSYELNVLTSDGLSSASKPASIIILEQPVETTTTPPSTTTTTSTTTTSTTSSTTTTTTPIQSTTTTSTPLRILLTAYYYDGDGDKY